MSTRCNNRNQHLVWTRSRRISSTSYPNLYIISISAYDLETNAETSYAAYADYAAAIRGESDVDNRYPSPQCHIIPNLLAVPQPRPPTSPTTTPSTASEDSQKFVTYLDT